MRVKLTEEEKQRLRREYERKYRQRPEVRARQLEYMRKYNQRPDVIAHRRDYYDNVALPRMCGLKPEPYVFPKGEKK